MRDYISDICGVAVGSMLVSQEWNALDRLVAHPPAHESKPEGNSMSIAHFLVAARIAQAMDARAKAAEHSTPKTTFTDAQPSLQ